MLLLLLLDAAAVNAVEARNLSDHNSEGRREEGGSLSSPVGTPLRHARLSSVSWVVRASGASAESSRARKAQAVSSALRHCGLCRDAGT